MTVLLLPFLLEDKTPSLKIKLPLQKIKLALPRDRKMSDVSLDSHGGPILTSTVNTTVPQKYQGPLHFRKVLQVPSDGHCLLYSFVHCMREYPEDHYKYNVGEVILQLRQEINRNYSHYREFLPNDVDLSSELQRYILNRNYNLKSCDIIVLALCNCFNVKVVILERTINGMTKESNVVKPDMPVSECFPKRSFFLLRTGDHYDPIVRNGESNYFNFT